MRIALAIAAAVLLIGTTAHAALLDPIYCRLWPSSQGCWLKPAPIPPVKPPAPKAIAPAPKVDTGRPMPKGPVVVKPQTKPKTAVRVKAKAKPKAAKRKRVIKPKAAPARRNVVVDEGPGLPWPCWMVRLKAGGLTCQQLAAEGARQGIAASPKQERQALACLGKLDRKTNQCTDKKR